MDYRARKMRLPYSLTHFYILICSSTSSIAAATSDTLPADQILKDGQTLISASQHFELGFFSPGNSSNRFFGIWYRNLPLTVVWVANRNNPITGFSGVLALDFQGSLSLFFNNTVLIWSVNITRILNSPTLRLLDNGNLVLKEENSQNLEGYIWQSFDHLTDTLLPEMKLGWNLNTGLQWKLASWLANDDPAAGDFIFSLEPPEAPQLVLWKGTQKDYRWAAWDGVRISGSNVLGANPAVKLVFNSSPKEVYFTFLVRDSSIFQRMVVNQQGLIQYLTWANHSTMWLPTVTLQRDKCDRYGMCGPYGNCDTDYPVCKCLKGFTPKLPHEWTLLDWSGGCVRKWELDCLNGDGFVKYEGIMLPDNSKLSGKRNLNLEECKAECLKNCSCMAYTTIGIIGNGVDCVMWFGDLVDMKSFSTGGHDLYIRMAQAEQDSVANAKSKKHGEVILIVVVSTFSGMLLFGVLCKYVFRTRSAKRRGCTAYWTRNRCKEALTKFWTRTQRVQK